MRRSFPSSARALFSAFLAFKFLPKSLLAFATRISYSGVLATSAIVRLVVHGGVFGGRDLTSHALLTVPKIRWLNEERWTVECTAARLCVDGFGEWLNSTVRPHEALVGEQRVGAVLCVAGIEYLSIDRCK